MRLPKGWVVATGYTMNFIIEQDCLCLILEKLHSHVYKYSKAVY